LDEAAAHRRACDIRDHVDRLLSSVAAASPQDLEKAHAWAEWAREQADALDPIVSGELQISD
jgi:hypothetical protein